MHHGKRYRNSKEKVEAGKFYSVDEAATLVKELATAKFDETVEAHFRLGVDPRKSDQTVRGTVALPHGTGRSVRVVAITQGDGVAAAQAAGADEVGGEELIARILEGWMDFDTVVATPDMMAQVGGKLGRVLGPRGACCPTPKPEPSVPTLATSSQRSKLDRLNFAPTKQASFTRPSAKRASRQTS